MARDKIMSGTLYGVGVGPGDPELMTVKAWRIISTAPVIAYLAANGGESTARAIAAPFIDPSTHEIAIPMPMQIERAPAQLAYDQGAKAIAEQLSHGKDVVVLCEGDPFFYGSFMYLFERLASRFSTVVVPGVTSVSACASVIGQPLCERDEPLKILPATMSAEALERELSNVGAAAIMKVGRHFGKVKQVLAQLSLTEHATVVEKATQAEQATYGVSGCESDALPYFTTIIVRKPNRE